MRGTWLAVAWVGSVVGAWFLGGLGRAKDPAPAEPPGSTRSRPDAPREATVPPAPRLEGSPAPGAAETTGGGAPPSASAPGARAEVLEPGTLDLEGVATPEEASRRLMAYAHAKLAQGPEGHLELLRTFDGILKNKELEKLFGPEDQSPRLIYPWLKFVVEHDQQVAEMTETLYRTMAERPSALEGLDDDTIEVFTEGLAMPLPAILSEERMERMRGWAKAILAAPEASQPEAVRRNRRRIERNLPAWVPPASPAQALEALRSGDVSPQEALSLLRRVAPEDLAGLDVVGLIGPLVEQGDFRALRAIQGLRLDARQVGAFDGLLLRSTTPKNQWTVIEYLRATGRSKWADARPFVEQGLRFGGATAEAFAQALANLPERPPAEFVRDILASTSLDQGTQEMLKRQFGLP